MALKMEGVMDIPSAVTPSEAFRLQGMARGKVVLEVGSLLGYSTIALAQVAEVVHSVDPHEGYPEHDPRPTLEPFLTNLIQHRVREKVIVHIGTAQQILPTLEAVFDFAFIDVNGRYEDTAYCLWKVGGLLKPGGWMGVHDIGRMHPDCSGATEAAQRYMLARGNQPTFMCETIQFFGLRA